MDLTLTVRIMFFSSFERPGLMLEVYYKGASQ